MIEVTADKLLLLVSSTILLSYVGGLLYKKTKIPDIIWVLLFGIVLGPVLDVFDKDLFLSISPLMSTVALSIILFDAGINVDIKMLEKTLLKSMVLALATFTAVVLSMGLLLPYILPSSFNFKQAMLLGAMVGGTSTLAVFGIIGGIERLIPRIESTKVILMMESVVSDPICIITSVTIIRMIMLPDVSLGESILEIMTIFILSSCMGFIVGLIWAEVLNRMRGRSLNYIVTLAILFPVYIASERIIGEGGGTMAALVFGLTITNYRYLVRKIGIDRNLKIDKTQIRKFHDEMTFFIKAFFFVYIGLIVTISLEYAKLGMLIIGVILVIRFIVATLVGRTLDFTREELVLTRLIFAQGLPAFVMSQLPFIFDPHRSYFLEPEIYPNLCMPIVLGTVLIAAIAGPLIAQRQLKGRENGKNHRSPPQPLDGSGREGPGQEP